MTKAANHHITLATDGSLSVGKEGVEGDSPEVVIYYDNGLHWEAAPMTDTLKIITFAGHPVPEDGLTVHPPQGGELTVWPDGGYAFMPPEGAAEADSAVTTYYSFVMEDIDGSTSVGTFALDPSEEMPVGMQDFQAWSLPELLGAEAEAARELLGGGEEIAADHGLHHVADLHVSDMYADFSTADANLDDDLNLLIFHSQNS
jgi:hypothetical protein